MKKTILIFAPYYLPYIGGLPNFISILAKGFVHKGYKIFIFSPSFKPDLKDCIDNIHNITIYHYPAFEIIPGYPVPKFWSPLFKKKWLELNKLPFDFQFTHTRFFLSSLFPFFGGTKKIRWIHVEHGSSYVKDRNIIVRLISFLYDQILGRLIYRKADSIICVSRQTYLFAQGLGAPKEKLKIINESLNPKDWKIHIKKANKILQITFCGRLVKSKGIQEILRALMNLKKYFWQLNIVGSGIYEKNLKKLSDKLQISEKIIWHGGKDQQFIKKVLAKTDIYISASHSEGFGLSLIEAGICRCCILASDIGGHKDIIDHEKNGKLFKVGDFTDLEKGLRNLIINKEKREKFGKNLERKVKLYFNKDKMLDLYEKEFEKF